MSDPILSTVIKLFFASNTAQKNEKEKFKKEISLLFFLLSGYKESSYFLDKHTTDTFWKLIFCINCFLSIFLKKTACLIHRRQMAAICGIKPWIGIHRNDTAAYLNDMILVTVNGSLAIFAFLSNLVIIVTVIKTPSLQKPCNILLSNLAFADCLTGVIVQPMFIVWRLFLQRARQSCLHQVLVFDMYYTLQVLTVGLSFVNVISFDRHYALDRPLVYMLWFNFILGLNFLFFCFCVW